MQFHRKYTHHNPLQALYIKGFRAAKNKKEKNKKD